MNRRAVVFMLVLLAACAGVANDSRGPIAPDTIAPFVDVVSWEVTVPRELKVSEANVYYPLADIVWRGDPPGDRYEQVAQIFESSLSWGMAAFNHGRKVRVSIELVKFHAITEFARYHTGGVHTIRFIMSVHDAKTGEVLMQPEKIIADLRALGRRNAVNSDLRGNTQKRRITQHLAGTVQRVLIEHGMGRLKEAVANGG